MATNIYLSVGDGATADFINLNAGDFRLPQPVGISIPPYDPNATTRTITVLLNIRSATTADNLIQDIRALYRKIRQAQDGSGPFPRTAGVTLGIQQATSNMVFWDVQTGLVSLPDGWEVKLLAGFLPGVVLTLVCLPEGRGAVITDSASATLTNGTGMVLYRAAVPGDTEPVTKVTVTDVSTAGLVVNRIRLGRRALATMASSDFSPILDLTATSPGTATTDSSSYIGANFARITASTAWQTIAYAVKPSAQYTEGLFDVWVRARDSSTQTTNAPTFGTPTPTAPSVRQVVSAGGASVNTLSATWSQATRTNSLLFLHATWGTAATITPPAGWTIIQQDTSGAVPGQAVYYKAGAASTSGSVTVSWSTTLNGTVRLIEVENASTAAIANSNTGSTSGLNGGTINSPVAGTTDSYQSVMGFYSGDTRVSAYTAAGSNTIVDQRAPSTGNASAVTLRDLTSSTGNVSTSTTITSSGTASLSTCTVLVDSGTLTRSTTYNLTAAGVDGSGNVSQAATTAAAVTTTYKNFAFTISGGSFNHYRWFVEASGGSWYAQDMDAGATAARVTGLLGGATTLPSVASSTGQFRTRVGLSSGTVMRAATNAVSAVLASSQWEMLSLGTVTLPPVAAAEGGTLPAWRLEIQGMHASATPNLDVDAVWLFPHLEPQLVAYYRDSSGSSLNLAAARTWVYDGRRDFGRGSVILYSAGVEAGQATWAGDFRLGPGDNLVMALVDVASGVSDVTNAKVTIQLAFEPRYLYLLGMVT